MKRMQTFTISPIRQSGNWSELYWFEVTVNTYNGETNQVYTFDCISKALRMKQQIEYKLQSYNFSNAA